MGDDSLSDSFADLRTDAYVVRTEHSRVGRTSSSYLLSLLALILVALWTLSDHRLEPYSTMGVAIVPVVVAAAAALLAPTRTARILGIGALMVSLVVPSISSPAQDTGDWPEYYLSATAILNHGSIDRRPVDFRRYQSAAESEGMDDTLGIRLAPSDGREYPYHFWLSSLAAVPFALLVHALGFSYLRGFAVMNSLLIAAAFISILHVANVSPWRRKVLAAFWILSPVTWYIGWPGAEVWSASLVMVALSFLTSRKYPMAMVCAALASTQNPPIIALVILIGFMGWREYWPSRDHGRLVLLVATALISLLPNVYYLATLGVANPIVAMGESSVRFITPQRLASMYFDLNQGMIMYVPGLLAAFVIASVVAIGQRRSIALALLATCLAMATLACMGGDWNSGCVGIMRWSVWQLPVMALLATSGGTVSDTSRGLKAWCIVGGQLAVVFAITAWPAYSPTHLEFGPVARYMLSNAPSLYWPEPDIFVDRVLHREISDTFANPSSKVSDPCAFVTADGVVTKVLTPAYRADRTLSDYQLDRSDVYRQPAGRPGLVYLSRR